MANARIGKAPEFCHKFDAAEHEGSGHASTVRHAAHSRPIEVVTVAELSQPVPAGLCLCCNIRT